MQDIRIERWAHTIVNYCLYVKPGDLVAIQGNPMAAPLIAAVYREILRADAHPLPMINLEELSEIFLREANDAQLLKPSPFSNVMAEEVNAQLNIMCDTNTKALTTLDPARMGKRMQAMRPSRERQREREMEGSFRWSLTLYPTNAYAQDTGMSLSEFEEFVFNVCFLNDPDPIARWKELSAQQQRYVDWLVGKQKIHVIGEGTDLTLSVKDRIFINSDGKRNFPSGEFFTSPVENSANGVITYSVPSIYGGRAVEDIRLVFKDGKVVEASAKQGQDVLMRMLDLDEGARYLGEFAFGNNNNVTHGTKNILFDEKIGGTVHLALGQCYPETGGQNTSTVHWDMICDLRKSGEVWVDDTLFLKDGKLLV